MEILGIGGWELVAILLIMLIVAGPKRMIQWSYTLGRYMATLRRMWSETAAMLQKELDEAGVDVKVPTQPPTRGSFKREVNKALSGVTKPIQDTMDDVNKEIEPIREAATLPRTLNKPVSRTMPDAPEQVVEKQNGHTPAKAVDQTDYGTWSASEDTSSDSSTPS
jgi:Sec-independent protein translocase protein TatA